MNNMDVILDSWRDWSLMLEERPIMVTPLQQGLTNQSYLISSTGKQWVLRINAQNSLELGINRDHEAAILEVTSQIGLSPSNYYNNLNMGFMVSECLPGWLPDRTDSKWLAKLASVMKRVHQQTVPGVPEVDYVAYSEQYIDQLLSAYGKLPSAIAQLRASELPFVAQFQSELGRPRLCHHDPAQNHWRLQLGEPCLIDWEYAALRDPACDLFMVCESWQLNAEEQAVLLQNYGDSVTSQRLSDASRVCRYIDALWFEIQKL